jgi:hypothetical protein
VRVCLYLYVLQFPYSLTFIKNELVQKLCLDSSSIFHGNRVDIPDRNQLHIYIYAYTHLECCGDDTEVTQLESNPSSTNKMTTTTTAAPEKEEHANETMNLEERTTWLRERVRSFGTVGSVCGCGFIGFVTIVWTIVR